MSKYYNPKKVKRLDRVTNIVLIKEGTDEYTKHYAEAYPDPSVMLPLVTKAGPHYFRMFDDLYKGYADKKEWYVPLRGKKVVQDGDWLYCNDRETLRLYYLMQFGQFRPHQQIIYMSLDGIYMLNTKGGLKI